MTWQDPPAGAVFNTETPKTKRSLLALVPIHTPSRQRHYILIDDIPHPWRLAFTTALGERQRPILADRRPAAYAWDWRDWVMDRSWDLPEHATHHCPGNDTASR
ncbi:MAG: hypothetical protein B7Z58_02515 [Acidiphilium sp. 37-64-53]|uniref:hypothetical protein n=1 Tax=Acidiphilium TaxID=522 RepID=UPI000BD6748B|nr:MULTISPECIES: hypothetical protein [Acidiphilium]OYW03807.1 MAG: hypothetical protein B7Z58_02515 [Acidiphilium sp. 37-64-53]OZB28808.1 MAG: hypothetical protein B7X49_09450 [Acidiphilium sp. 34-64-41]HQT83505.1 hypothetical protein [Acidiphilium rubrum]